LGYTQKATRKQSNKTQGKLNGMKHSDFECGPNRKLSGKQHGSFYPVTLQKKWWLFHLTYIANTESGSG